MNHPFVFVGHGRIAPDSIGKSDEARLIFEKAPSAALRRKIEEACPPPLAGAFTWKGATLTAESDGDTFDASVIEAYGGGDRSGNGVPHEAAAAFSEALEAWACAVHAMSPLRAFVAPGRVDGFDDWDDWSRAELARNPVAELEGLARAGVPGPASDRAYARALEKIQKLRGKPVDYLDLSEMALTRLPPELFELDVRGWLMLDENPLPTVPPEISRLRRLKKLIVRDVPLESLPDTLADMPLRGLELGLSLSRVGDASVLGRISTLEELDVRGLARLPDVLPDLPRLVSLAVGDCVLENIDVIWRMTSLETLQLTGAKLRELPDDIARLQSLRSLYLDDNALVRLPLALTQLPALKTLSVAGNPLPGLPKGLRDANRRSQVERVFEWVRQARAQPGR